MPILTYTIEHLPCEILYQIFEYLTATDRNSAALACTRWYHVINQLNYVMNDSKIVFNNVRHSEMLETLRHIMYKKVRAIQMVEEVPYEVRYDTEFWISVGQTLTEIEFMHCTFLDNESLICILRHLKRLKVLKLYAPFFSRWGLFRGSKMLVTSSTHELIVEPLNSITHLTICDNSINDSHLLNLLNNLPNLKSLNTTSLYFRSSTEGNPTQLLTSQKFITWLESQAKKIKELQMKIVDENLLKGMSEISSLKLEKCFLELESTTRTQSLYAFIKSQTELEHISLDLTKCLCTDRLVRYCQDIQNLKELYLGPSSTLNNLSHIKNMTFLKKLSVYVTPATLPSDGCEFQIVSGQNEKLKDLTLISGFNYNTDALKPFTIFINNFKQLTSFTLLGFVLSDKEVQSIFRIMEQLRELTIANCEKLTDKGMCGWSGQAYCKQYALENLKGLQRLSLSGCRQITDKSLKDSFRLPEVQSLILNGTLQVTNDGLSALVELCPSLEQLHVSSRTLHMDKSMINALKFKFKRLKKIHINSFNMVDLNAIHAIGNGEICFPFDR